MAYRRSLAAMAACTHASFWQGHSYGNNKYGSITRTLGTLDNPLGSAPPVDVTINPNPDPTVNPLPYQSYRLHGPVSRFLFQVPRPGIAGGRELAGGLRSVDGLPRRDRGTIQTQSFDSCVMPWRIDRSGHDLEPTVGETSSRINQGYRMT